MNLMKLFGVSILAAGLTACGGAENAGHEEKAAEAAPAAHEEVAKEAVKETTKAVEEAKEAVTEAAEDAKEAMTNAVEEAKEAAPEPQKLEMPEGMVEGSVEHSIWLNSQGQ